MQGSFDCVGKYTNCYCICKTDVDFRDVVTLVIK